MSPRARQIAAGLVALALFLPLGFAAAPPGAALAVVIGTAVVVAVTVFLVFRATRR